MTSSRSTTSYLFSSPQIKRGGAELSSPPSQGMPITRSESPGWQLDHKCGLPVGVRPSAGAANHGNHSSTQRVGSFCTSWDLSLWFWVVIFYIYRAIPKPKAYDSTPGHRRKRIEKISPCGMGGKGGTSVRRRNRTTLHGFL